MKKIIVLAMIAACGLQSQAQIVSSRSSMTTRQVIEEPRNYRGWSTLGIEYLPSTWKPDNGSSESFSGLALNWTTAYSLSQSIPLFLEWGIGAQWSFYSEGDIKINCISAKIPLNLIYDFQIPNTTIALDPYFGLRCRGNIWGEEKWEYKGRSESIDIFDDGNCKRFQVGWQIGIKARFNNSFYVGAGYGTDFNEWADDVKINEASLSLGLVF